MLRVVRGHSQRNSETWAAFAVDLMHRMGDDAESFDMHLRVRVVEPKPGQKDKQTKPIK